MATGAAAGSTGLDTGTSPGARLGPSYRVASADPKAYPGDESHRFRSPTRSTAPKYGEFGLGKGHVDQYLSPPSEWDSGTTQAPGRRPGGFGAGVDIGAEREDRPTYLGDGALNIGSLALLPKTSGQLARGGNGTCGLGVTPSACLANPTLGEQFGARPHRIPGREPPCAGDDEGWMPVRCRFVQYHWRCNT
jgi:hypothetical protein